MNPGRKLEPRLAKLSAWKWFPAVAGLLIALLITAGSLGFGWIEHQRALEEERSVALGHLSLARARLEGALNDRLLLGRGLVSYVSLHPDITHEEFQSYAASLVGRDPMVRNISLIKNTSIVDAYPFKGNEKAIGVDLAQIPSQRPAIMKVIETRKPIIDGPLDLVQGGRGLIHRVPVLLGSGGTYWGQVSVVLNQVTLLVEANLEEKCDGLCYALRKRDEAGTLGDLFWGSEAVLKRDPVVLDVVFPSGSWQLAAAPETSWGRQDRVSAWVIAAGLLAALASGYLVFRTLSASRRIEELESILPICANCKKIRDDQGYWEQVDLYFTNASNLRFSHGICPDCAKTLYGVEKKTPAKEGS
jgi:sensor domain CHASE-containing protein